MNTKGLFSGRKFEVIVDAGANKKVFRLYPYTVLEKDRVRMVIRVIHGKRDEVWPPSFTYAIDSPFEIFSIWRAIMVIERMRSVSQDSILLAYQAVRYGDGNRLAVDAVTREIGWGEYMKIMDHPIPDTVIDRVTELLDCTKAEHRLSFEEELLGGTMKWRENLHYCKVEYPKKYVPRIPAEEKLLARYQKYLRAYADDTHVDRWSEQLWQIESYLLMYGSKGMGMDPEPDFVFGAALVRMLTPVIVRKSQQGIEAAKLEAIDVAAAWIHERFTKGFLFIHWPKHPVSFYEYRFTSMFCD